ncbi:MAG: hypothetical protein QOE48_1444 [Mycobacterium sp.]|nr:hypothetical protein [Mycobacterium sp.]
MLYLGFCGFLIEMADASSQLRGGSENPTVVQQYSTPWYVRAPSPSTAKHGVSAEPKFGRWISLGRSSWHRPLRRRCRTVPGGHGYLCPSDQRALISTRDLLDAAGSGGSGCVMLPSSQEVATSRSRRRTGAHAIRSGRHAAAVDPFAGATAACVRIPPGQRARRVVNRLFFRMREGFRAASVLGVRSRRSTRRRTT